MITFIIPQKTQTAEVFALFISQFNLLNSIFSSY